MKDGRHIKIISRGSPLLGIPGQTRKGVCLGSVNTLKQCINPVLLQQKADIRACNDAPNKQLCTMSTLKC
jgi:hypothetical protein